MTLEITRGDGTTYTTTVLDGTGARLDLTGKTVAFTAKRSTGDTQAAAIIAKTTGAGITHAAQTGLTLGQATITLLPADTSGLPAYSVALDYDVQVTTGGIPATTERGLLLVTTDVTTT